MLAATDPPPPSKPSRYRTIRGKNVPESRRFVEPAATPNGAPTTSLPTSISSNSNGTTSSNGSGSGSGYSGYSDLSSRRPTPVAPSAPVFRSNDVRPPLPSLANGGSWNMADAVRHAPPAPPGFQQQYQQQQHQQQPSGSTATISAASPTPAARPQHRPPPLHPTHLDTSANAPAPSPAPILVPLPSARARGMVGAEQHEMLLSSGITLDADEVARRDAEAERLLAEQKRKDLERLQRELANHQPATLPPKSPSREKFAFLTRRRGLSSAAPPTPTTASSFSTFTEPLPISPISPSPGGGATISSSRPTASYTSSRTHSGSEPPLPSSTPIALVAPASAAPQQMDVPSSAPGSGANRHIIVRCRQFSVTVPITPETTVGDALDVATKLLPRAIDLAGCALTESYTKLGLERRLRRYERVRDILNSWDSDNDNAFVVMLSDASGSAMGATSVEKSPREKKGLFSKSNHDDSNGTSGTIANNNSVGRNGHASDLDLSSVSRSRSSHPPGFVFLSMYHSQKPGRWSKRFITLVEETGQLVASKKADESRLAFLSTETSNTSSGGNNNSGGDFQNLCHLSDYDIYTPTDAQMHKHLRPPKTYCFAIKSQQRTTVFLNTDNYVHFFSTDDVAQARLFYDRVFAWRSWYLVNRQLALPGRNATKKRTQEDQQQQKQLQQSAQPVVPMPPSSAVLRKTTLQRSLSRKSASNAPGGLVDKARHSTADSLFGGIGNFDPTLDLDRSEDPDKLAVAETRTRSLRTSTNGELSTFASSGLLGNGYDERRKAETATQVASVRDRHHHHQPSSGSFKGTASAAAAAAAVGSDGGDTSWFPSASEHTARQRSKSIREITPSSSRPPSGEDIPLGLQFPQLVQQQQAERDATMSRSRSVRRTAAPPPLSQQLLQLQQQQQQPSMPSNMPAPLIDLTPKFQEAPQWSKEGKGHGVRAPPGTTHLVDLATDRKARMAAATAGVSSPVVGGSVPPPSNANLFRRDGQPQATPSIYHGGMSGTPSIYRGSTSGRSQTMTSSSAAVAAGFLRSRSLAHRSQHPRGGGEVPPVPLLSRIPGGVPMQDGTVPSSRERSTTLTRN